MITLTQLEYIIAIDTYRHFVTASEKCFVTQPTLSMQIKKLEDYLGVTIFDRTKQPIIPTDIGIKIIKQARVTIAESKKINEIIEEHNAIISGELTIGIIPSLAPYLLPLFIGKLTKEYPLIQVTVVELLSEDIIERLKKDTLDVGLLVTPLNESGIVEKAIFYEKMLLFANKTHQLSKKKKVKIRELTANGLWMLRKGHCFRSQIVNLCSFRDKTIKDVKFNFESGSLETIKKIIETEGGYTLLPELAAENINLKNTTIKSFESETPVREVGIVYSRNYVKKQLLKILSKVISESVPEEFLDKERGQIVKWR